jgi:hypothetical protein
VAFVADRNELPEKLVADVLVVQVMDFVCWRATASFADAARTLQHEAAPLQPFVG